jgi:cytochrome c oxidase subunit II
VLVYFLYSLIVWRGREEDEEDGPALHGHARVQTTWITVTSVIVLCLFGFGTYELYSSYGAGSGEGPTPIYKPAGAELTTAQQVAPWSPGKPVVVQVIGQQWRFTYRYPQFGGFETTFLAVPQNQWIQFDVTSLDVIHSFWAYQLGVKADANPGVDNIAYSKPTKLGSFTVRCAELCGLWHGAMYDYGQVMTPSKFTAWANATRAHFAPVASLLPPYASTYDSTVIPLFKLGKVVKALGLFGAGGGFYPTNDPAQP